LEFRDLEQLKEWRNNPELRQWFREYRELNDRDQESWLMSLVGNKNCLMFGIVEKFDHKGFVGVCGLTYIDYVVGKAEFSLYIAEEFKKQGYGEDALRTLCKYAFEECRMSVVTGEVLSGNPALKMFLALGFKQEGVLRKRYFKGGKHIDSIMISVLPEELK
jgi:RimJ/RimL family protein N-acetyltransferase